MKKILRFSVILMLVIASACEDDSQNMTSKLPGTWFCEESSSLYGQGTYYVEITRSTLSDNEIILDNFYHLGTGVKVTAFVDQDDMEIQEQAVSGFTISGTGKISDDGRKITISFTADDQGEVDAVSAVLTKH